jgi:hypothetical protein
VGGYLAHNTPAACSPALDTTEAPRRALSPPWPPATHLQIGATHPGRSMTHNCTRPSPYRPPGGIRLLSWHVRPGERVIVVEGDTQGDAHPDDSVMDSSSNTACGPPRYGSSGGGDDYLDAALWLFGGAGTSGHSECPCSRKLYMPGTARYGHARDGAAPTQVYRGHAPRGYGGVKIGQP